METHAFALTPDQKSLLVALAQETGKPIPALLAAALEAFQEHVQATRGQRRSAGRQEQQASSAPAPPPRKKPLWDTAAELVAAIPAEGLARLPVAGAAQPDPALYGTPKRTP
jgi:hypothetical protein